MGLLRDLQNWWISRHLSRGMGIDIKKTIESNISSLLNEGGDIDERKKPWLNEMLLFIHSCDIKSITDIINLNSDNRLTLAMFIAGATSHLCIRENLNELQTEFLIANSLQLAGFSDRNAKNITEKYRELINDKSMKREYQAGHLTKSVWRPGEPSSARKILHQLLVHKGG